MAAIKITDIINLTESPLNIPPTQVRNLCMVNEPNNELVQYYMTGDDTEDKATNIVYSNYTTAQWGDIRKRLTARSVSKIGIKAFPGIGSYGFYKDKNTGLSTIVYPINPIPIIHKAPTLKFSYSGSRCHFEIEPPPGSNYECYRIVFSNGDFSEEYITYETTYDCDAPGVLGTYEVYCIGYVEKEQKVSSKSNKFSYTVTSGSTAPGPSSTESYYSKYQIDEMFNNLGEVYTKQEIDAMIGKIDSLLDKLNGTVV